ncbi:MAG TPA: hypothetical protein VN516_10645 [Candidatus Baltobacteraceae bacterium]|nr:hypothetical protein [Candidatus Baltobacteraceae bacterium]
MKKIGGDIHAAIGASGFFASITLSTVNQAIACLVGVATLGYMSFKALREWRKWQRETQKVEDKNQMKL